MVTFTDRVPTYPGRVRLTPVAGQSNVYDLVRADQPTEVGTALNAAFFTAFKDGMVETGSYAGTGTNDTTTTVAITLSFEPKALLIMSDATAFAVWIKGSSTFIGMSGSDSNSSHAITVSGTSVSWSANGVFATYMNNSGRTYYYVAFA